MEWWNFEAGIRTVHIPYASGLRPALTNLLLSLASGMGGYVSMVGPHRPKRRGAVWSNAK
jgi:hypothetical protein